MRVLCAGFCALLCVYIAATQNAAAESFHLKREGGVLVLPVQINGSITLDFTIDSGAADVVIPHDVFSTLLRTGTITSKDMLGSETYELADGSRHVDRRFRIRSLKIGDLELRNVVGSIAPAGGALLLGQSFLSRLPGWTIDNKRELLVIGGSERNLGSAKKHTSLDKEQTQPYSQQQMQCASPVETWFIHSGDKLARIYPRFGTAWLQYQYAIGAAIQENPAGADKNLGETVTRAEHRFTHEILRTAEPQALRIYDALEMTSEADLRKCGIDH